MLHGRWAGFDDHDRLVRSGEWYERISDTVSGRQLRASSAAA